MMKPTDKKTRRARDLRAKMSTERAGIIIKNFEYHGNLFPLINDCPEDPYVHVSGLGVYTLSALKQNVKNKINNLSCLVEQDDFTWLHTQINSDKSILKHTVQAIVEVEKELLQIRQLREIETEVATTFRSHVERAMYGYEEDELPDRDA